MRSNRDLRAKGYVLKRTNYGEADRILNIITPNGKISAIAKGARKEKSKLAGGIEMFTLTDFNIHMSENQFGIVTSAKMLKHHSEIIKDWNKIELASEIIKKISRAADHVDNPEYFGILDQSLSAINVDENSEIIEAWFLLRLKKSMGEEINLYRDIADMKLVPDKKYSWNMQNMAFEENIRGEYGASEIKMLRLMVSSNYDVIRRIKLADIIPRQVLQLVRRVV